jgi:hypothetical protein
MFAQREPKRKSDRQANAELTREELRLQGARMRESLRTWYQRLTRRKQDRVLAARQSHPS